jgi:[protein-PII] uridylyltransferase
VTIDVRDAFERARGRVEELQRAGTPASEIVELHARDVDLIVVNVFEGALAASRRDPVGIALVALGGYGRRELAPNSDLDLLLLYRGWDAPDVTELNRRTMYPLWDSRRDLGDRIREPRDIVRSLDEIDEACALLDARLLSGDRGLFADMQGSVWRRLERSHASFVAKLTKASEVRHRRYGHAGHLLEPNIRDSAGGLRDIHTLLWASKLFPGGEGLDALVDSGYLSRIDADLVDAARSFLLRVRIELHLGSVRHQDQLYLPDQDEIARRLAYEAPASNRPAADHLMQELFRHARHVETIVASFWDRISRSQRRRRWRSGGSEMVGDGCVLKDGRLELVATTNVADDPAGWLRVFRRAVLRGVHVGRASLNRLYEELAHASSVEWSKEAREVFLDIIESGGDGFRALEEIDTSGLLTALIPEWAPISAYPQRDLYHRYTVDRHLFSAVASLAASRDGEDPEIRDAWAKVGDPDALFVATLLHDVGKGRAEDHSALGAEIAAAIAERMGLSGEQIADVAFLVRNHLALAETATRRDLNEPRAIEEMGEKVGGSRRLAMLYLLTRADSLATGPEAWSSFRSSLVRELYGRTREFLAGAPLPTGGAAERLAELAAELELSRTEAARLIGPMPETWITGIDVGSARRQLELLRTPIGPDEVRTAVNALEEADEFIVVAPDRTGLFSMVAGVLALRGLDVHDAEIYTRADGVAVEVFRVRGTHGSVPEERWPRLRTDIVAALSGSLDLDAALSKKAAEARKRYRGRRRDQAPRVVVDNTASGSHTVVEVHTEDRLGLLRTITKTLTDAGCDLSLAKVATYGVQAVDVFYLRDLDGRKITDTDQIERIERGLRAALQQGD